MMPDVITAEQLRELIQTMPEDTILRVEFIEEGEHGGEEAETVQAP